MKILTPFKRIFRFYFDGFSNLSSWGRSIWIIILIKLFILFAIIRVFFMPDILKKDYKTDNERSRHVLENLTTSVSVTSELNSKL
ncbi:MAG: DUF4492 domain-containing protein [Bacteroidetes bacterium GWF2_49_14]|nr:MAG: DUF4492 domain-containing protein [Bacteroidetes bacterium GWF2_49_14]